MKAKKNKHSAKSVKSYWEKQAKVYKESDLATAPDHFYREHEIASILTHLKDGARVLDVGCGNGYSTLRFARSFPHAHFVGVDYSETMINHATRALKKEKVSIRKRVSFFTGDVLALSDVLQIQKMKFDYIVSERCIINLKNWEEQKQSLIEMRKFLKKNGRIILVENTQEGLARLNTLRKQFSLHAIGIRWHNFYVPEKKFLTFVKRHFILESTENIGNLYYIVSRVVYAKLAQLEGKEPRYDHPINEIASKLPPLADYKFSPNYIFVLRKRP